jgi:hypothetical protein
MVPYELQSWVNRWSRPRRIEATIGLRIAQLSAGDMHTALLTDSGQLLLCGSGTVVPPYLSAETIERYQGGEDEDDDDDGEEENYDDLDEDENEEGSKHKKKKDNKKKKKAKKQLPPLTDAELREMMSHAVIVSSPRRPSASWLQGLTLRTTVLIASSGSRMFALQDSESICQSLMWSLYKRVLHGDANAHRHGENDDSASVSTAQSWNDAQSVGSYFEKRGKSDCMIVGKSCVVLAYALAFVCSCGCVCVYVRFVCVCVCLAYVCEFMWTVA